MFDLAGNKVSVQAIAQVDGGFLTPHPNNGEIQFIAHQFCNLVRMVAIEEANRKDGIKAS